MRGITSPCRRKAPLPLPLPLLRLRRGRGLAAGAPLPSAWREDPFLDGGLVLCATLANGEDRVLADVRGSNVQHWGDSMPEPKRRLPRSAGGRTTRGEGVATLGRGGVGGGVDAPGPSVQATGWDGVRRTGVEVSPPFFDFSHKKCIP
eukprot:TRINITY_DN14593_c0_g1_i1.p2 TRINITY_DN14593_c0_g1~~TRINITY_DN14593_c0_g1_i1.p2  ORF type:complete len:148 (+),score=18.00 TRINITY_DN14593_c0_g1_i1:95-538(+)